MEKEKKRSIAGKLAAYSLAAGAAALASQAVTTDAAMVSYDNGGAGWFDQDSDWNQDHLLFKMDGTVMVNSGDLGPLPAGLPKDDDSFTFQHLDFYWWGTEEKDAHCLNVGANCGYVAGFGDEWNVGRLGADYEVGDTLADGRVWSDHAVTSTGGTGGWYFYFAGEWPFGGGGYVGLYCDAVDGRHYGWANINSGGYSSTTLYEFAFSTTPGQAVAAGGGEVITVPEPLTLSLLAVGAAGLAARRRKRA